MGELGKLARQLTLQEADVLAAAMPARALTAGATLIRAGDFNDTLFFVTRGELLVSLPFERGPVFVGARPAGSWVGEVTLLEPGPASATVTASEDSEVRALSAATLGALMTSDPQLVARVVRALSEDLAHRIRSAGVVLEQAPAKTSPGFFRSVFGRLFGGGDAS